MAKSVAKWMLEDTKNSFHVTELVTSIVALLIGKWSWWILVVFILSLLVVRIATATLGVLGIIEVSEDKSEKKTFRKSFFSFEKQDKIRFLYGLPFSILAGVFFGKKLLSGAGLFYFVFGLMFYSSVFDLIYHNFFEKKSAV